MGPFISLYSFLLILDVLWDWYRIEYKNRQIKHDLETVGAGLAYTAGTILLVLFISRNSPQMVPGLVLDSVSLLITWAPIRWIWHDLLLNLVRRKPLDYLGSEQQSAESDKLLNRWASRGVSQYVVKLAALGLSLVVALSIFLTKPWIV